MKRWLAMVVSTSAMFAAQLGVSARPQLNGGPGSSPIPAIATPAQNVGAAATPAPASAVVARYCIGCHNDRLKTAGLSLTPPDSGVVVAQREIWERVVRKLRTGAMPPPGVARPDATTTDAAASWIEHELDLAASAHPDPGRLPTFQRLTRTEYQNAIRDLFLIEDLPKEMDLSVLLPADNASSGFDNLRDRLFVSSTQLEQYLTAARKISRLVVGDPSMPALVDTYVVAAGVPQDGRLAGLPAGTRGGTVVRTYLPFDADYLIHVETDLPGQPQQLDVSVDGQRVAIFDLHPPPPPPLPVAAPSAAATGTRRFERDLQAEARRKAAPKGYDVTVRLAAGQRVVTATFLRDAETVAEGEVVTSGRGRGGALGVNAITVRGPMANISGPGDTAARRHLFVCRPKSKNDELKCATEILTTLARRAYRRSVVKDDIGELLASYEAGRADGGFERGIQRALERVLVSPQFLFRIERDPAGVASNTAYRISDIDLASRLSFFIWSSIPDDELLEAASKGTLSTPAILESQIRRMLADARSRTLTTNFAAQWLFLRDVAASAPNPFMFPSFNEALRDAFTQETTLFIDSVFREDRSLLELLTANYTFVNGRLAKHYDIPGVYGSEFRRVTLPSDSPRRGLLGQGSILMLTSHANRTSPVLRGKYVLDNLLAAPPPPPPPNIPALVDQSSDGTPLPLREAMAKHRSNPVCSSCHARMDPLGFALENFDGIGRWRTRDGSGAVIDTSASLPDGTALNGVDGLRDYLVARPELFVNGITEKLLTYAVGRKVSFTDAPVVRQIVRSSAASQYRLSALVSGIVNSVPFRMRQSADATAPSTASR